MHGDSKFAKLQIDTPPCFAGENGFSCLLARRTASKILRQAEKLGNTIDHILDKVQTLARYALWSKSSKRA
jgi:hypothetical protein